MSDKVVYLGRDLEAMSFAVNYHRWILETFRPYLGEHLVEVGAGTGSFSELLLERPSRTLAAVEPSRAMYSILTERLKAIRTPAKIVTYNALFREVADEIKQRQQPDSIIYVNVMEHIEDDEGELGVLWRTLAKGGRAFIFVPALPALYGNFDREIGHFRRYTKRELEEKCLGAGFKILRSGYFDLIGTIPWWIKYRLLKSSHLDAGAVKLYDKFAVPVTRLIETALRPPLGKNLILIAEKG